MTNASNMPLPDDKAQREQSEHSMLFDILELGDTMLGSEMWRSMAASQLTISGSVILASNFKTSQFLRGTIRLQEFGGLAGKGPFKGYIKPSKH